MKTTKPFKEQGKDIFSPNRSDLIRAAIWICLIIFFLVTPAIILFVTIYIAAYFSLPNAQGDAVLELKKDASILLLSFYAGTVGAVIKYLFDRLYEGSESDAFMAKISKLLLGWLLGSCAFFVIKSGWIIKLLYPKLDTREIVSRYNLLYWQTVVLPSSRTIGAIHTTARPQGLPRTIDNLKAFAIDCLDDVQKYIRGLDAAQVAGTVGMAR